MAHLVAGLFSSSKAACDAVAELKGKGYTNDISLIAADPTTNIVRTQQAKQTVTNGMTTGATIGGVTGILAGVVAGLATITVPGIGALLVSGPLAVALGLSGGLAGALAGGLVGGFVDAGFPPERAQMYADRIKKGEVFVSVSTKHDCERDVSAIMKKHGVKHVDVMHA